MSTTFTMSILKAPRAAEFIALLHQHLSESTLRHVISVAAWMDAFAAEAGIDSVEAVYVGLLHDLCKKWRKDDLLKAAGEFGLAIDPSQRKRPKLLHGPVAAEIAKRHFGLDSEAVYEAIYWHTTGRSGLGRLGQALYFADFSEPFRTMPEAKVARDILRKEDFDAALRYVAKNKLEYVRRKADCDPATAEFLTWLTQATR